MLEIAAVALVAGFAAAWLLLVLPGHSDWVTWACRVPRGHYRNKVVWVTGASSGIGRAMCEQLAAYGAHLILTARNRAALETLAATLRDVGAASVHVVPVDLALGAGEIAKAADAALALHGRLDVLANNAGVGTRAYARDLQLHDVHSVMQVNFLAAVELARRCLPALTQARGTIINTSSLAATIALPLRSTYAASKAALERYFDAFRLENRRVHVLSLCPGRTASNFCTNAVVAGGRYGKTDDASANGVSPQHVARKALAAAACGVRTAWVAVPKELAAIRVATYFPALWSLMAARIFASKH